MPLLLHFNLSVQVWLTRRLVWRWKIRAVAPTTERRDSSQLVRNGQSIYSQLILAAIEKHFTINKTILYPPGNQNKVVSNPYGRVSQTVVRGPLGVRDALTGVRGKMRKLLFSCRI